MELFEPLIQERVYRRAPSPKNRDLLTRALYGRGMRSAAALPCEWVTSPGLPPPRCGSSSTGSGTAASTAMWGGWRGARDVRSRAFELAMMPAERPPMASIDREAPVGLAGQRSVGCEFGRA